MIKGKVNIFIRTVFATIILAVFPFLKVLSASLDSIRSALVEASSLQLQEKVYLHTDNTCYFVGDTIWYKAYVVRADDLDYTDISKLLYVELLNPDGLLVERQTIIVSDNGYCCGNISVPDSLYSGYYELRAYTRWMLNFNVTMHRFSRNDTYFFYSTDMAMDYFRQWDGLYSRVFPIYEAPDTAGDYNYRRIYTRPKQRLTKSAKPDVVVNFYPEGGHLIKDVSCRVAFEATDQDGMSLPLKGEIRDGSTVITTAEVSHQGKGAFTITPGERRLKATFVWDGKTYDFDLPEIESSGVALYLTNDGSGSASNKLILHKKGNIGAGVIGLSVLCRGVLKYFSAIEFNSDGIAEVSLPTTLPTGVNNVTIFNSNSKILADRLFFVNNHDYDAATVTVGDATKRDYEPYERIDLDLSCSDITSPTLFSVSVRDARTDDPSYDDGDMMTDLLLSSELKGFIANPAWYFIDDDKARVEALDLLMMVQGWRKYKWQELSDTTYNNRRYTPETTLTLSGQVFNMLDITPAEPDEIDNWKLGQGRIGTDIDDEEEESTTSSSSFSLTEGLVSTEDETSTETTTEVGSILYGNITEANANIGVNHGNLKKEVIVEAEVIFGTEVVGSSQMTQDQGRFIFAVPPFYGDAILNMKAYKEKDSLKKGMTTTTEKHLLDETAFPDFYVKRDMFFPIFSNKYNYYQTHAPEEFDQQEEEDDEQLSDMETDDHLLATLKVKGKRRGKRAINFNKPAYTADAYDIYNDMTDYGLSFGMFDMRQFPLQVARFLYGNMGRSIRFNVDGRINNYTYYRSYTPDENDPNKLRDNVNARALYEKLQLKSLKEVRVFSDYEPRNEDIDMTLDRLNADVTVEMTPFPDGAQRHTFRDRHIILHGINEPDDFYSPDYSNAQLPQNADYRRTLYWNPNAQMDETGHFNTTLYNNGRQTRIKISVAGITTDGKFLRMK